MFKLKKMAQVALCLLLITSLLIISFPNKSVLADASSYNGGELIDNPVFTNSGSMGAGDIGIRNIQSFLNSRGGFLANYTSLFDCSPSLIGQTSNTAYTNANAPCGQSVSAATIIYYAAQVYSLNPQVIITTMQKEQALITASSYDEYKINYAMGFGCPTSSGCSATTNSNFMYQVDNGTWDLRYLYERASSNNSYWNNSAWACNGGNTSLYTPSLYPNQNVTFKDENGVPYATYYIANAATSALYCYTPHTLNNFIGCTPAHGFSYSGSLPNVGNTGLCYAGSANFVKYFTLWFGSPYSFIYNGVNYSPVFDPIYYINSYSDLRTAFGDNQIAAFNHFISNGMNEGRQGNANFNVTTYRDKYPDLRWVFGTSLKDYYIHYITNGQDEGRTAAGTAILQPVTKYKNIDYSNVYNFSTYLADNQDIKRLYSNDDTGAIQHFVNYGMNEGRQASSNFNVESYQARYYDLRRAYGNNLNSYYLHYLTNGKTEGRIATGDYRGGITDLNGIDYSAVYSFNDYENYNSDIKNAYRLDDIAALKHFVNYGMNEGRQASSNFNVYVYKARYSDLQAVFGNNLKMYYIHYITNGKAEGRSGL